MKHVKTLIAFALLFMVVGFAVVTTSLSINADMELLGDLDNFEIYYSRAVVNGEVDPSIIVSSTELDFGAALKEVGTPYIIEYDITNASSSFDAEIEMICTGSTEYFEVSNVFDTSEPLRARKTRTGTLTLKKVKTLAGDDINSTVSCSVVATPIEREAEVESVVATPVDKIFFTGREIIINGESFYVISTTEDKVKLLTKYWINDTYEQTRSPYKVIWPASGGWEYEPGPKEVDVQVWAPEVYVLIEGYAQKLRDYFSDDSITSDLITVQELGALGCYVPDDYYFIQSEYNCDNSYHLSWLTSMYIYFTKSAMSSRPKHVFVLRSTGVFDVSDVNNGNVVRPVITISKDTLNNVIDALGE